MPLSMKGQSPQVAIFILSDSDKLPKIPSITILKFANFLFRPHMFCKEKRPDSHRAHCFLTKSKLTLCEFDGVFYMDNPYTD